MIPPVHKWINSPQRNSLRLEINATLNEVWKIAGNPAKIFSNCSGVNRVEINTDDSDNCTQYTIWYDSEDGGADVVASSTMVWYETNQGWASLDDAPNPMGFEQSMTFVIIEQRENKSILNWNMYYNIANDETLQMFITALDHSLKNEIAQQFIHKFGGRII